MTNIWTKVMHEIKTSLFQKSFIKYYNFSLTVNCNRPLYLRNSQPDKLKSVVENGKTMFLYKIKLLIEGSLRRTLQFRNFLQPPEVKGSSVLYML